MWEGLQELVHRPRLEVCVNVRAIRSLEVHLAFGRRALRNAEPLFDGRYYLLRFSLVEACAESAGSLTVVERNHPAPNSP